MEKSAKYIIIRILIVVVLCIISIPLWFSKGNSLSGVMALNIGNEAVSLEIDQFKSLIVIDDARALDIIEPRNITVTNNNSMTESIYLVFLVSKTSSVDYHYVRVSLDDKIYDISKLNMYEDADNYYFVLENINMEASSTLTYKSRIWINDSAGKLPNTSTLTANFIIK